jgi:uncharacterized protein (DUF924 family)
MVENMADESSDKRIEKLLDFWFEGTPDDPERLKALMKKWFAGSADFDRDLRERFGPLAEAAGAGQLDHWSATARGRLALIILLDQFPRNLYRGTAAAFAQDQKALHWVRSGLDQGQLEALQPLEQIFFCMPLQHAESREIQALSTSTFAKLAADNQTASVKSLLDNTAKYAVEHSNIVEQFGRFPHRNRVLGRDSTDQELEFLASGGPSFGQ